MFKLINKANYLAIKTFVNQYKYKVCVNSILDGNSKGQVFTDDEQHPKIVLIFNQSSIIYVYGQIIDLEHFNENFHKLLEDFIIAQRIKADGCGVLISFFEEKYWEEYFERIIDNQYLLRSNRWVSEFIKDRYLKFKNQFQTTLLDGYTLCIINRDILSLNENKELQEVILDSWIDIDDYFKKGFGYCVIKDSKVISAAYSYSVSDNRNYEISIYTFNEQERKKGFAANCAIAFIDKCLENNLLPYWETDWDNYASQKLATKIGFSGSVNENRFQFYFKRADNYLVNTYLYFIENDSNYIKTAISKALENQDQQPSSIYIYTCAEKLSEKGIFDQAIRLLNEYLKIDKSTLQSVKDNAKFKPLHDTEEWAELLKNINKPSEL